MHQEILGGSSSRAHACVGADWKTSTWDADLHPYATCEIWVSCKGGKGQLQHHRTREGPLPGPAYGKHHYQYIEAKTEWQFDKRASLHHASIH